MTKEDIRKRTITKRDSLSPEELQEKSRQIFEKLIGTEEYRSAEDILVYASMRSEVITDDIILDSLSEGKRVFCPKVTDKNAGTMEFVRIFSLEDLKEGYFGIREPEITDDSEIYADDSCKSDDHTEDSLIGGTLTLGIMPGVAFDHQRNRIGYSGGFYDRYLEKHPYVNTIALCMDCQLWEETIPDDMHDVRPQKLITETAVIF